MQNNYIDPSKTARGLLPMEWISVKDEKPKSGVHVLLGCETSGGNRYVCDGYYAERWGIEVDSIYEDCNCEYNEDEDAFYLEEGWYEVIKNWDDFSSIVIYDKVTHWMPLPEPPKEPNNG